MSPFSGLRSSSLLSTDKLNSALLSLLILTNVFRNSFLSSFELLSDVSERFLQ